MSLIRCTSGHFYDKEMYKSCPYCERLHTGVREWIFGMEDMTPNRSIPVQDDPELLLEGIVRPPAWYEAPSTASVRLDGIDCPEVSLEISLSDGQEAILGRDIHAGYVLNSRDLLISRRHCSIKWNSNSLYLKDMNSTNGTFLNGKRLSPLTSYWVQFGDVVRVGQYEYKITYTKNREQ